MRIPRDIIVFRILTGAATFARSIRAFNVGDGGSIERLDNGGSFFGKPISRGSPDSFQQAHAARRIFEGIMSAGVLSESDKDGDRRRESGSFRLDLYGWMTMIDNCVAPSSLLVIKFRQCHSVFGKVGEIACRRLSFSLGLSCILSFLSQTHLL